MTTKRTDAKANQILEELGPNNNGRFAAMADFARTLEKENSRLLKQVETLTIPIDKALEKAFWEGHSDGKNNQIANNKYKTCELDSNLVKAYDNGFHSGQAERQDM